MRQSQITVQFCFGQAARLYEESLDFFIELGSSADIARSIHNLGYVALAQGDAVLAAKRFVESLALFRERESKRGLVECLAGLASVISRQNKPRQAAQLLGAVETQFETIGATMWPADRLEYERTMASVQAALDEAEFAIARTEGRALTLDEAIALAQIDD